MSGGRWRRSLPAVFFTCLLSGFGAPTTDDAHNQLKNSKELQMTSIPPPASPIELQCCPAVTMMVNRTLALDERGWVLELKHSALWKQTFVETYCHPLIVGRKCQYLSQRYKKYSLCEQTYTYVYAIGRPYMSQQDFKLMYVRNPSGCKCKVYVDDFR